MIILESREYDVYLFKNKDHNGHVWFTVRYGLEQTQTDSLTSAMDNFYYCFRHSVEVNQ